MRRSPPRISPGTLTVRDADALNDALRDLYRLLGNFTAIPPLAVSEDQGGVNIRLDRQIPSVESLTDITGVCPIFEDIQTVSGTKRVMVGITVEYRNLSLLTEEESIYCVENPDDCCPGSGSGSGTGPPIITDCCPGVQLPRTMCATLEHISGCACFDGAQLEMRFDDGSNSLGGYPYDNPTGGPAWCGNHDSFSPSILSCVNIGNEPFFLRWSGNSWQLMSGSGGAFTLTRGWVDATSFTCDPFQIVFDNVETGDAICDDTGTGTGFHRVTITPGACLSGSGPAPSSCCADGLPQTLTLTLTDVAGCDEIAGDVTLTYDPTQLGFSSNGAWMGTASWGEANFWCDDNDGNWHLLIYCNANADYIYSGVSTAGCTLPITFADGAAAIDTCCGASGGTFSLSIDG